MGFEPTRAEHIGLAVQRLNHSATSSVVVYQLYSGKISFEVCFEPGYDSNRTSG